MCTQFFPSEFVNRDEFKQAFDYVNDFYSRNNDPLEQWILHILGPAESGKSWLLCKLFIDGSPHHNNIQFIIIHFEQENQQSVDVDIFGEKLLSVCNQLIDDQKTLNNDATYQEIKNRIIEQISLSKLQFIFLIDDISLLQPDDLEKLEDHLLANLTNYENVCIIFAGRSPTYRWKTFALRPDENNTIHLKPFEINQTDEQLTKQFPEVVISTKDVQEISNGVPGFSKRIAEYLIRGQDEKSAIKAYADELIGDIDPNIRDCLPALSILNGFYDDEAEIGPILELYTGNDWDRTQCTELVRRLERWRTGPGYLVGWNHGAGTFAIEENIRKVLEQELRMSNFEMWKKLHLDAYRRYNILVKEICEGSLYEKWMQHHTDSLNAYGIDVETNLRGG